MSFLNGKFPGRFLKINRTKANRESIEALKAIYPTAIIILNRNEIEEMKSVELIERVEVKNIEDFSKTYEINKRDLIEKTLELITIKNKICDECVVENMDLRYEKEDIFNMIDLRIH